MPAAPPGRDQEATNIYYGLAGSDSHPPCGDDEGYSLDTIDVTCPPAAPPQAIAAAHPRLAVDLATADGRAIYDLFSHTKQAEHGDESWPGSDVVTILQDWFTRCGLDIAADAPELP